MLTDRMASHCFLYKDYTDIGCEVSSTKNRTTNLDNSV